MVANMSSRGTRPVLQKCRHAFRSVVREPQGRRLSNTRAMGRYGPVPEFHKVCNPELAITLENYRNNVVMPAHLAKQQRDMIVKPKYQRQLELEPVIANLSGEEFELKHLPVTGRPSDAKTFNTAMLLTTPEEWDNIPKILTALKTGKFDIMKKDYPMRLVRHALKAGRLDVVVKCLEHGNKTGLQIRTTREAVVILRAFAQKAEADSTLQDIEETVRWMKRISDVLSIRENRQPPATKPPTLYNEQFKGFFDAGQKRPDVSPEVVGAMLEVFAIRATKFHDGLDKDGSVLRWAQKMISLSQVASHKPRPIGTKSSTEQNHEKKQKVGVLPIVEEELLTEPRLYELRYEYSNFMPFQASADIEAAYKANPNITYPTEFMVVAWLSHRLSVLNGLKLASKVLEGKPEAEMLDYLCKKLSKKFYQVKGKLEEYAKFQYLMEKITFFKRCGELLPPGKEADTEPDVQEDVKDEA